MSGLTISNPVIFSVALSSPRIYPGDTLWLLPGMYTASAKGLSGANAAGKGVFRAKLNGTAEAPITIRAYTPGTVRINGGLEFLAGECSYLIVRDLEIAPTPTSREMPRNEVDFPGCVYCTAPGMQFLDNYLHDGSQGFSVFGTGGCKIEGNVVTNIGWIEDDGAHGAAIYTHNHNGGEMTIRRNVFHTFGEHGVNLWSASGNNVKDYLCQENVILQSTLFCGGDSGVVANNYLERNHVYGGSLRHGVDNRNNGVVYLRDNVIYAQYVPALYWWMRQAVVTGNVFVNDLQVVASYYPNLAGESNTLDENAYYYGDGLSTSRQIYDYNLAGAVTWDTWQARGLDANSSITSGYPTSNLVSLYTISATKALAVVWNWETLDTVSVDLSALGWTGQVTARNVQDYFAGTQTLDIVDGSITVNMQAINRTVATPIAWTAPATTFPAFGAFVLERAQ